MIYTIPASSPVYNVTYVVVSNPTPTTVEMSYSAGYMGMFVMGMAVGATIVYCTGYYYPPYVSGDRTPSTILIHTHTAALLCTTHAPDSMAWAGPFMALTVPQAALPGITPAPESTGAP